MSKDKTLCEIFKKDMDKKSLEEYADMIKPAKFICKKCGRAAKKEDYVCKSYKIKD
ncbi:MAG: hypothetical protein PWQ25_191 [Deferribacteres bacterium]|jgi:thymidine kinase|nr:hypothetical protein [Deferribacteraceae bacterium]MDK2791328.1 hypothetical protein [Deferribacteres bacterium]